jgi:sugar lactone lactonase YvrE
LNRSARGKAGSRLCTKSTLNDGRLDRSIALPVTNPTCVCLGGPAYRTLFITTARKFLSAEQLEQQPLAGSVLAIEVDVPGLPERRFEG